MQALSGLWTFKTKIKPPDGGIEQHISFCDGEYQSIIASRVGLFYILLGGSSEPSVYDFNTETWTNEEKKRLDFGEEPQQVSDEFYAWFIRNAIYGEIELIKQGTYEFREIPEFEDEVLEAYIDFVVPETEYNKNVYSFRGSKITIYKNNNVNYIKYAGSLYVNGEEEIGEYIVCSSEVGWQASSLTGGKLINDFGKTVLMLESTDINKAFADWFSDNVFTKNAFFSQGFYQWKENLDFYMSGEFDFNFVLPSLLVSGIEYELEINKIVIEGTAQSWIMAFDLEATPSVGAKQNYIVPVYSSDKNLLWNYGSSINSDIPAKFGQIIAFEQDITTDATLGDWFTNNSKQAEVNVIKAGTYKFNNSIDLSEFDSNYTVSLPIETPAYIKQTEYGFVVRQVPQQYRVIRINNENFGNNTLALTDLRQSIYPCYEEDGTKWEACYNYCLASDESAPTTLKKFGQVIRVTKDTTVEKLFADWFKANTSALLKDRMYNFNSQIQNFSDLRIDFSFISNRDNYTQLRISSDGTIEYYNTNFTTTAYANGNWTNNLYKTLEVKTDKYIPVSQYEWLMGNWTRQKKAASGAALYDKLEALLEKVNTVTGKESTNLFDAYENIIGEMEFTPEGTITLNTNVDSIDIAKYARAKVAVPEKILMPWTGTIQPGTEQVTYRASQKGAHGITEFTVGGVREKVIREWPDAIVPKEKEQQVIEASDKGWDGISKIIVEPIPDGYVVPWKEETFTSNKEDIDVTMHSKITIAVPNSGEGGSEGTIPSEYLQEIDELLGEHEGEITFEQLKDKINNIIEDINNTTDKNDLTIIAGVDSLVGGYMSSAEISAITASLDSLERILGDGNI